MYIYIYLDFK